MPSTFQLALNRSTVEITPGATDQVEITIVNGAEQAEEVAFTILGVDPSWAELTYPTRMAPAQGEAKAPLTLRPPLTPTPALAGLYPLVIHGQSTKKADVTFDHALAMIVRRLRDFRLQLVMARASGVEGASYPVHIVNDANAPLEVRLDGGDPNTQLWVKADPYRLRLPPGGEGDAVITVKAPQSVTEQRVVRFSIKAQGQYLLQGGRAEPPVTREVAAEFIQLPAPRLWLDLDPAEWRASASTEGAAPAVPHFRLSLTNPGPSPVRVELMGQGSALGFEFSPSVLDLAPQGQSQADLTVHTPGLAVAEERVFDFEIETRILTGLAQPAARAGRVVQRGPEPPPPPRWPPWWMMLAAFVVAALFLSTALLVILFMYAR